MNSLRKFPPALCFVFLALSARCDLYTGLVSYWPMDANNSGATPDASFHNDLTLVGAPTVVAGQVNKAIKLTPPPVSLPVNPAPTSADPGLPIFAARTYTICMWVKAPNTAGKALLTEGNTGNTGPIVILQTP